jgi:sugar/nucleoside kinase (ribokinase family)
MNRSSPDAICIGYCTVDLLFVVPDVPEFGKRVRASAYLRQPGGMAATTAVSLARLGVSAGFVGKIGDDPDGQFILDEFTREGVDVSGLIVEPGTLSRATLVTVDGATGERGFTTRPDTCAPLRVEELDRNAISNARVLLVDDATDVTVAAAQMARDAGTTVVLDGTRLLR